MRVLVMLEHIAVTSAFVCSSASLRVSLCVQGDAGQGGSQGRRQGRVGLRLGRLRLALRAVQPPQRGVGAAGQLNNGL